MIEETTISEMLDRLGKAVSGADLGPVSACYAFPGVFMIGGGLTVFEQPVDFQKLFAEGRGPVSTGTESIYSETSHYIAQSDVESR